MEWLHALRMRLRALVKKDVLEQDLDEELRFHLEMQVEQNLREGMTPDEARRQALIAFGGVEGHKEACRDARGVRVLEDTGAEMKYALRSLRKNPGFTAVAIFTLAVGIGATTAVFSLANWVLLRPVPGVEAPEELAIVQFWRSEGNWTGVSYANLMDLARAAPAFSGLAGYQSTHLQAAFEGAPPRVLSGETVVGDYFGVLGMRPQRGRFFQPDELLPASTARVAVISDALWRTGFSASSDVLGQRLRLNGSEFTVVGIAPPKFRGVERLGDTDVWLPPAMYPVLRHEPDWNTADRDASYFFEIIGRFRPGATPEMAQEQLRSAMERLVESFPEENEIYTEFIPTVTAGVGVPVHGRARIHETVRLLLGIVSLVLLIACANVANLLLFRGVRRRGEMAMRRALGASASRILRQHLAEGIILSVLGASGGVLIAVWMTDLFEGQRILGLPRIEELTVDWRVLTFALLLALGTGVLFGLFPAWVAWRQDFLPHLKDASRTGTGRGSWLRGTLTIAQVSASIVLLVGALLLARTLHNLSRVEVGFDPERVLAFGISPDAQGYSEERVRALRQQLIERIGALPGTRSVSLASSAPFAGAYTRFRVRAADAPEGSPPLKPHAFFVSPDYFTTLEIPLLAGRTFTDAETFAVPEAAKEGGIVISRNLARKLFGDVNPLGKRVIEEGYKETFTHTVVGIADDTRASDLRAEPELVVYRPLAASWQSSAFILIRSALPRASAEAAVQKAVTGIDRSLPFFRVEMLSEAVAQHMDQERLLARVIGLLALLAALLAAIGLYGVIAYSVAQRTREIGIRMALGAHAAAVVRLVARQSVLLVGVGLLLGVAGAVALSRVLESRLFGVEPLDPFTYAAAGALFALVALIATAAPARTAVRVDPVDALRSE
jgi:predicted permease